MLGGGGGGLGTGRRGGSGEVGGLGGCGGGSTTDKITLPLRANFIATQVSGAGGSGFVLTQVTKSFTADA